MRAFGNRDLETALESRNFLEQTGDRTPLHQKRVRAKRACYSTVVLHLRKILLASD